MLFAGESLKMGGTTGASGHSRNAVECTRENSLRQRGSCQPCRGPSTASLRMTILREDSVAEAAICFWACQRGGALHANSRFPSASLMAGSRPPSARSE
jgi:hypothetical protein